MIKKYYQSVSDKAASLMLEKIQNAKDELCVTGNKYYVSSNGENNDGLDINNPIDIKYFDKSISKWERGDSVPDVFVLKELANIFGIKVSALLDEDAAKSPRNFVYTKRKSILFLYAFHSSSWQSDTSF